MNRVVTRFKGALTFEFVPVTIGLDVQIAQAVRTLAQQLEGRETVGGQARADVEGVLVTVAGLVRQTAAIQALPEADPALRDLAEFHARIASGQSTLIDEADWYVQNILRAVHNAWFFASKEAENALVPKDEARWDALTEDEQADPN